MVNQKDIDEINQKIREMMKFSNQKDLREKPPWAEQIAARITTLMGTENTELEGLTTKLEQVIDGVDIDSVETDWGKFESRSEEIEAEVSNSENEELSVRIDVIIQAQTQVTEKLKNEPSLKLVAGWKKFLTTKMNHVISLERRLSFVENSESTFEEVSELLRSVVKQLKTMEKYIAGKLKTTPVDSGFVADFSQQSLNPPVDEGNHQPKISVVDGINFVNEVQIYHGNSKFLDYQEGIVLPCYNFARILYDRGKDFRRSNFTEKYFEDFVYELNFAQTYCLQLLIVIFDEFLCVNDCAIFIRVFFDRGRSKVISSINYEKSMIQLIQMLGYGPDLWFSHSIDILGIMDGEFREDIKLFAREAKRNGNLLFLIVERAKTIVLRGRMVASGEWSLNGGEANYLMHMEKVDRRKDCETMAWNSNSKWLNAASSSAMQVMWQVIVHMDFDIWDLLTKFMASLASVSLWSVGNSRGYAWVFIKLLGSTGRDSRRWSVSGVIDFVVMQLRNSFINNIASRYVASLWICVDASKQDDYIRFDDDFPVPIFLVVDSHYKLLQMSFVLPNLLYSFCPVKTDSGGNAGYECAQSFSGDGNYLSLQFKGDVYVKSRINELFRRRHNKVVGIFTQLVTEVLKCPFMVTNYSCFIYSNTSGSNSCNRNTIEKMGVGVVGQLLLLVVGGSVGQLLFLEGCESMVKNLEMGIWILYKLELKLQVLFVHYQHRLLKTPTAERNTILHRGVILLCISDETISGTFATPLYLRRSYDNCTSSTCIVLKSFILEDKDALVEWAVQLWVIHWLRSDSMSFGKRSTSHQYLTAS